MYFYDIRNPPHPRKTSHGTSERHPTRLAFCLTTYKIIEYVKQFDSILPDNHELTRVGASDYYIVFRLQSGFNAPESWGPKLSPRTRRWFNRALKEYGLTMDLIKNIYEKERLLSSCRKNHPSIILRDKGRETLIRTQFMSHQKVLFPKYRIE